MASRRGGYTLVEVLVASVVMLLLMTSLYTLLIPMLKAWMQSNVHGDTQREALIAATEMAHSVRLSAMSTISIQSNTWTDTATNLSYESDALTVLSPIDHQAGLVDFASRDVATPNDTCLVWHQFVVYYLNHQDNTLRASEVGITPSEQPTPCTLDYTTFTPSPRDRVLAHNVYLLQFKATGLISTVTPPSLAGAIQIMLELKNQGYDYQEQTSATPLHQL